MYVANMVNQREVKGYKVSQYIDAINKHLGKEIIDILITSSSKIPKNIQIRYKELEEKYPTIIDKENIKIRHINTDLTTIESEMIRYDSYKLGYVIFNYLMEDVLLSKN